MTQNQKKREAESLKVKTKCLTRQKIEGSYSLHLIVGWYSLEALPYEEGELAPLAQSEPSSLSQSSQWQSAVLNDPLPKIEFLFTTREVNMRKSTPQNCPYGLLSMEGFEHMGERAC